MAKAKLMKVYYSDGREVEVAVSPKAQVKAERHFGMSLLDLKLVEHAYYLAWSAVSTAGLEERDFDAFLDVIDDVEAVTGEGPPAFPTGSAQRPATSSS